MRVLLPCAVCAALAGCEPSPGDIVDTRTVRAGALEVSLVLREEGTWGNPANGQHFELWCRRGGSTVKAARGYWVEGGLVRAPIERVVLDGAGFLFTDLMGGAVFSFNWCRDVATWNGILPAELAQLVPRNDELDEVDLVVVCPGGPELAFRESSELLGGRDQIWVMTRDAGRSWAIEARSSAPQMCPAQKEILVPPVDVVERNSQPRRQ